MLEKRTIAIFGGSFNPPLNSHFSIAEQIIEEYENIEKIVFVPVSKIYKKSNLIGNEHRYNMLKLVCDKNSKFSVSDVELKGDVQLHTIETLELLKKDYSNYELCFIIGTDNLKDLPNWNTPDLLLEKYNFLVVERDNDNIDEIISNSNLLSKYKKSIIKVKNNIRSNISSTFVREKLINGKSIRYNTPDEVYYYIKDNNLYID